MYQHAQYDDLFVTTTQDSDEMEEMEDIERKDKNVDARAMILLGEREAKGGESNFDRLTIRPKTREESSLQAGPRGHSHPSSYRSKTQLRRTAVTS